MATSASLLPFGNTLGLGADSSAATTTSASPTLYVLSAATTTSASPTLFGNVLRFGADSVGNVPRATMTPPSSVPFGAYLRSNLLPFGNILGFGADWSAATTTSASPTLFGLSAATTTSASPTPFGNVPRLTTTITDLPIFPIRQHPPPYQTPLKLLLIALRLK